MTISQEKVGKLLEQSKRPEETEEVLLAYCFRWVWSLSLSMRDSLSETWRIKSSDCSSQFFCMLYSKWTNGGNQAQVLRKLHLLTLYLRAVWVFLSLSLVLVPHGRWNRSKQWIGTYPTISLSSIRNRRFTHEIQFRSRSSFAGHSTRFRSMERSEKTF